MTQIHTPNPKGHHSQNPDSFAAAGMRLDKFLWATRFFKSRSIASDLCRDGRLRLNRRVVDKAHATVRIGDVLTFPQGDTIRVIRVVDLPARRGATPEAHQMYEDLSGPTPGAAPGPILGQAAATLTMR